VTYPAAVRRTVLPLALFVLVLGAFTAAAWCVADGNDLAGIYFLAVAIVALRAQTKITEAVTA
jgi:hypothetical protein